MRDAPRAFCLVQWFDYQTITMKNMIEQYTFGSVCSGIEAASVAWNPLGWKAAWLAEIEPFPCALLAHHYPDVPNLGDMTKIALMLHNRLIPAPDIFCGGTPCQAFSVAGLRNSLDDARGNLSLTFCEIANEIDARRAADGSVPSIIFWENVPGVLNTKDNAFGCFLAGLAGEDDPLVPAGDKWTNAGCVFGPKRTVAWRVLDAQYFGVAQPRRRVFVVASAREGFDPARVLFEFEGTRRDTAPARHEEHQHAAGRPGPPDRCWWDGGQLSQTLDAVLYKKQALPEKSRFPAVIDSGRLRFITPIEAERLQGFHDGYTDVPFRGKPAADGPRYKALGNSWAVPNVRWIGERIDRALRALDGSIYIPKEQE